MRNLAVAAILLSGAVPAVAAPHCDEPYAPEIHDVDVPTTQQLKYLRDDVQSFMTASDMYQACLLKAVKANAIPEREATKLIEENQLLKEQIGGKFNELLRTYRQANTRFAFSSNLESVVR